MDRDIRAAVHAAVHKELRRSPARALVAVLATAALGAVLWWLAGVGRWDAGPASARGLGKRRGPLSTRSGPGASGREASPDDPARGHRGAARAGGLMGQARAGGRRGRR
jgi:hypothetical protein